MVESRVTHHKPNPNPNDFCLSLLCLSTYRIINCQFLIILYNRSHMFRRYGEV